MKYYLDHEHKLIPLADDESDDESDWQRERRDAWVRFAAASMGDGHQDSSVESCAKHADQMLNKFDARFGKKEEAK